MKIYIYCPRGSDGAYALVKAVGGIRLRRFDGIDFWDRARRIKLEKDSLVICWGATVPELDGIKVLNSMDAPLNKYEQAIRLAENGVATINVTKPEGNSESRLRAMGYMPRSFYHQGGTDLLGRNRGDYWVRRENFKNEYRVHSFAGKSIRAGQKVVREGFKLTSEALWKPDANLTHPWIRSWDGGWGISYKAFKSTIAMREIAHKAVKTLGLTFGAVDLGSNADGELKVLEVNTSPGIEGGTLDCYVRAIQRWIKDEPTEGD